MPDDPARPGGPWAAATFLGGLAAGTATELLAMGVRRQYASGTVMLREGAVAAHAVLLLTGFAKVTTAVEGLATLLGIRLPGEVIGEIGVLTGEPRNATVTACGRVGAVLVPRADFEAFLRRRPEAATSVTAAVVRQLRWANRRRSDFAAFPAHLRLARVLTEIAEVCGRERPDGSIEITVPLSQPELATMIAIAQATMHKAVGELRERNLVATGYRRVVILDPAALRRLGDAR
ncbi:Crp/Fnr family transcriptional regulator [Actinoplanes sp. RD1]|uniref:Crp/Fnr family transcriptional regulator n=1 Tax=Actinoplanes sp. RD1 TaxID=3064538 RepID=UPI0027420ABC|nr:Crp/Fnr family transcriptional regulator [Actinoplanes sp. RD1]